MVPGLARHKAVRARGGRLCGKIAAAAAHNGHAAHRAVGVRPFHGRGKRLAHKLRKRGRFHRFRQRADTSDASGKRLCVPQARGDTDAGQAECLRQHVVYTALRLVQIRMHAYGGNALPHQQGGNVTLTKLLQRAKYDRVVRNNCIAPHSTRFPHRGGGDVQRAQHARHLLRAAHQNAHVVPALRNLRRGDAFQIRRKLCQAWHVFAASSTAAASASSRFDSSGAAPRASFLRSMASRAR